MCNPSRVDISTTRHLGHGGCVHGIGKNDSENIFASYFLRKEKNLSPIVGTLSTTTIKKVGLGLLNPVTSSKEKYPSSQKGSKELIRAVTGGGEFSNANHLRMLGEERRDRQKYREVSNITKLKGLVRDLKGSNRRLIICDKITGSWLSVRGTTVSGTVLSAMEFRDFLCARYNV